MAKTVIGFFDNASEAQQAVENLVDNNISRDNIDISSSRYGSDNTSGMNSAMDDSSSNMDTMDSGMGGSTSGMGGSTSGMGGSTSGMGGSTSGMGGSTSGMGGSTSGMDMDSSYKDGTNESGIGRFFRNLFGNNDEANTYSRVAETADTIVTVHAQSTEEADLAAQILDDYGAVDVDKKAAEYGYSSGRGMQDNDTSSNTMNRSTNNDSDSIQVIEEQLEVGKREVETGGVRLRSRIVERPVEENLRLREERVRVERKTVDRPVSATDLDNFQEREIEIVERAEVPVVSKEARVVEEIKLSKDVEHRDETVKETVRKTEVDVENLETKKKKNKK